MNQNKPNDIEPIQEATNIKNEILKLVEKNKVEQIEALMSKITKIHKSKPLPRVREEIFAVYTEMIIFYVKKANLERIEFYVKKVDTLQSRYSKDKIEKFIFQQLIRAFDILEKSGDEENSLIISKYMMKLAKRAPYREIVMLYTDFTNQSSVLTMLPFREWNKWQKIQWQITEYYNNSSSKSIDEDVYPVKMFVDILSKNYAATIIRTGENTVDILFTLHASSSVKHDVLGPIIETQRIPSYPNMKLDHDMTMSGLSQFAQILKVDVNDLIKHFDDYGAVFTKKELFSPSK